MLKYDDGTPASTPQMAHDVSTFLDFVESHHWPDLRLDIYMVLSTLFFWVAGSWIYVRYHEFNYHGCILNLLYNYL